MKRIVFVTPPDARYGFSLVGVQQVVVGPDKLHKTLLELVDDPGIGVVVIDERLVTGSAQERIRQLEQRWPCLIVVLPAPGEVVRVEEDYAMGLIRRAIGYQVRLSL